MVEAVNAILPDAVQISPDMTGDVVKQKLKGLPAGVRAEILNKEFNVELETVKQQHTTIRAMLEAEAAAPHTTRPYIAKGSFIVVAFACILAVSIWAWATVAGNTVTVRHVTEGWQFILAVIGPLVTLLWSYFGVLRKEQSNRLNAANGLPTAVNVLSKLFTR